MPTASVTTAWDTSMPRPDDVRVDDSREVLAALTTAANAIQELAPKGRRRALEALNVLYGEPFTDLPADEEPD